MGDLVNLRQFRKQKNRQEKETAADRNRTKFGLSGTVKNLAKKSQIREASKLDGHRITTPKDD